MRFQLQDRVCLGGCDCPRCSRAEASAPMALLGWTGRHCCSSRWPWTPPEYSAACPVRVCELAKDRGLCRDLFSNLSVTQNCYFYFITVIHYLPTNGKEHLYSMSRISYCCSRISHKYKILALQTETRAVGFQATLPAHLYPRRIYYNLRRLK